MPGPCLPLRRHLGAVTLGVTLASLTLVTPTATAAEGEQAASPSINARVGYALFWHARSLALEHNIKPSARVNAWWPLWQRIGLGAGATAVLDPSPNYWVWGAYASGRLAVVRQPFDLNALVGLGLGHDADILHPSLDASGRVLPYGYVGIEALFDLTDQWQLGLEIANEQLSVVHLGVAATYRDD